MFSFDRYQMKVTDESQDPAGSRLSDKRIFRTAGHKFSPALGTIIIILVAAKGRARFFVVKKSVKIRPTRVIRVLFLS
jgi:hypothetical protein